MKKKVSKKKISVDVDLGLIELINILWLEKKKIIGITIGFVLIGFIYTLFIPKHFEINKKINVSDNHIFLNYQLQTQVLNSNYNALYGKPVGSNILFLPSVTNFDIFDLVIKEIKNNSFNLPVNFTDKEIELIRNSIDFKINKKIDNYYAEMSLIWKNDKNLDIIFELIFSSALENVKKRIINQLKSHSVLVKNKNMEQINILISQINSLKNLNKLRIKEIIKILNENLRLAKQLDIQYLFNDNLSLPENYHNFILEPGHDFLVDNPYYLLGYDALQKIINNLLTKDIFDGSYKVSPNYSSLMYSLIGFENDQTSQNINKLINLIENSNEKNWVNYNSPNIPSPEFNEKMFFSLTIIIGLLSGIFLVLLIYNFRRLKLKFTEKNWN